MRGRQIRGTTCLTNLSKDETRQLDSNYLIYIYIYIYVNIIELLYGVIFNKVGAVRARRRQYGCLPHWAALPFLCQQSFLQSELKGTSQ